MYKLSHYIAYHGQVISIVLAFLYLLAVRRNNRKHGISFDSSLETRVLRFRGKSICEFHTVEEYKNLSGDIRAKRITICPLIVRE